MAPFGLGYDSNKIASSRLGPAATIIELILRKKKCFVLGNERISDTNLDAPGSDKLSLVFTRIKFKRYNKF